MRTRSERQTFIEQDRLMDQILRYVGYAFAFFGCWMSSETGWMFGLAYVGLGWLIWNLGRT